MLTQKEMQAMYQRQESHKKANKYLDKMKEEFEKEGIVSDNRTIIELINGETGEKYYTYQAKKGR